MIKAKEFYEKTLARQREILELSIKNKMTSSGNPIVRLPFDTYPAIEKEMDEAGWIYDSFISKDSGEKCAMFYPKQYNIDFKD